MLTNSRFRYKIHIESYKVSAHIISSSKLVPTVAGGDTQEDMGTRRLTHIIPLWNSLG